MLQTSMKRGSTPSTVNSRSNADMANWALGFISGAATLGGIGDPLWDVDYQGVEYWLDNYCRDHPDELGVYAVEAFIGTHH
jgi:hypothetical protein